MRFELVTHGIEHEPLQVHDAFALVMGGRRERIDQIRMFVQKIRMAPEGPTSGGEKVGLTATGLDSVTPGPLV